MKKRRKLKPHLFKNWRIVTGCTVAGRPFVTGCHAKVHWRGWGGTG